MKRNARPLSAAGRLALLGGILILGSAALSASAPAVAEGLQHRCTSSFVWVGTIPGSPEDTFRLVAERDGVVGYVLTWESEGGATTVHSLGYSTTGGRAWTPIVTNQPGDEGRAHAWAIPAPPAVRLRVTLTSSDGPGRSRSSTAEFEVADLVEPAWSAAAGV